MDDLITGLASQGGGYLLSAIFLTLYLYERKIGVEANLARLTELKATNDALHKSVQALEKVPEAMALMAGEFRSNAQELKMLQGEFQRLQIARGRDA